MATPVPERDTITVPPDGRPLDEQPAWRQDFPIDWPQDHYVERRDFVKFLTLTSLAFVVGQFWIAGKSWMRRRAPAPPVLRVASRAELAVGSSLVFDYPAAHDTCVLVRVSEAEFVAFSQKCTHLSCAVIPRPQEGVFHCPCHEGIFDLRTGRVLAGPPPRPLPRIRLEVRGDDVFATGVDVETV
jgi:nitrite reductase/ring-hydroxylating ferredoxin subunit